eukprot:2733533-Alexandrium_andersonii.AAC.1
MSASLVGSEMCIRDRCWSGHRCRCRCGDCARAGASAGAVAIAGTSTGTVSYTHLTLPTICSV